MDYVYRKGDEMIKRYVDLVSKITSCKYKYLKRLYKRYHINKFKRFLYTYLFKDEVLLIQNLFDFGWITVTLIDTDKIGTEKNNLSIRYYKSDEDLSRDVAYYNFNSVIFDLNLKIISDRNTFSTDLTMIYKLNDDTVKKMITITDDRIYRKHEETIYDILMLIINSYIDLLDKKLMEM